MAAMEQLSEKIAAHFENFKLVAESKHKKRGQCSALAFTWKDVRRVIPAAYA